MIYVSGGDDPPIKIEMDPIKIEMDNTNASNIPTIIYQTKTKIADQKPSTSTAENSRKRKASNTPAKPPPTVDTFWPNILEDVKAIRQVDAKNQLLPLARIKKIMKLDENAKMIAAEAPLLFAKACEYFIQELTLRAWIHTEENKRRTLQRSDIATAISIYDQFDFLIDIVPREEIKPPPQQATTVKKEATVVKTETQQQPQQASNATVTTQNADPIQYFLQLGQQQNALQNNAGLLNQGISINASPSGNFTTGVNIVTPQNIFLTAGATGLTANTQPTIVNSLQNPQQLQLIQQVVTASGEIQNVPVTITPQQMNLLRLQSNMNNAQVLLQPQQQAQILQISTPGTNTNNSIQNNQNPSTSTGIFLNTSHGLSTDGRN